MGDQVLQLNKPLKNKKATCKQSISPVNACVWRGDIRTDRWKEELQYPPSTFIDGDQTTNRNIHNSQLIESLQILQRNPNNTYEVKLRRNQKFIIMKFGPPLINIRCGKKNFKVNKLTWVGFYPWVGFCYVVEIGLCMDSLNVFVKRNHPCDQAEGDINSLRPQMYFNLLKSL